MSGTRTPITRVAAAVAAAIVSIGTLTACAGGPGAVTGGTADDSWTVLTYMIADTNLEYFQMEDMREQEAVGSRPGFNLVSYLDRSDGYSDEDVLGLGDFTGAKTIHVKVQGGSEELADAPNSGPSNTGDPQVLADFIEYAITKYPAAHYALILNDHGSSWPGVGADGSADDDQLTLAELHDGIEAGIDGAGIDKLDMIGFDACLMATYETASTLQTLADRMVSSQELEPGYGWDYTALETAARGGSVDDLAASIITAFGEQSLAEGEAQITLSSIDLTKFAAVDTALDEFTAAVTPNLEASSADIGRALTNSLSFGSTPDYNFFMTDLGQLASQLGGPGADLAAAIDDAVITTVDGQATRGASGLAIYFPPSQNAFNPKYTAVEAASGWTDFLNAYYAAGQATAGDLAFVPGTLVSGFNQNGFIVAQQVATPANQITDVSVYYGYVEGGQTILVGEEPGSLDDENYAVGFFDTYQLWIGDGSNETSFYSSYEVNPDADVATIGVPIAYYPAGSNSGTQAFLQMTYAPSTGTILSETFYGQDSSGAFAELAPDPGATFEALKIDLATNTFFQSSPSILLSADPDLLQFDYRPLPSGTTIYAQVVIVNSAGQALAASGTGIKP
ncbi:MAG: clostripain-related cysteine peptidase [Microbacteriaceae bacterium]